MNMLGSLDLLISDEFVNLLFEHPRFKHKLTSQLDRSCRNSQVSDTNTAQDPRETQVEKSQDYTESINMSSLDTGILGHCNPPVHEIVNEISDMLSGCYSAAVSQHVSGLFQEYERAILKIEQATQICMSLDTRVKKLEDSYSFHCSLQPGVSNCDKHEHISICQYRQYQQQVLKKMEVCISRNSSKIESIFSDKLNSSEMKCYARVDELKENIESIQKVQSGSPSPGYNNSTDHAHHPSEDQAQNRNLVRKLKNSKSIGHLLGFK